MSVAADSRGRAHRTGALVLRENTRPPDRMTVSQWADRFRVLSPESSPEPGPWRTSRVPYLGEIMDTLGDPFVRKVVWVAASQVAKTECLMNYLGSRIHKDPAPIMVIQSTLPKARSWSKIRLAPMVRDSPALRERVKDPRARDSGNTTLQKVFPGGHVTIVGANSPSDLSSDPIRDLLADEVDRYPASAGTEGDPLSLGIQRTRNFWNRKVFLVSSPGDLETSRIWPEWLASDRRRFFVPCPHCDHFQVLLWSGVQWDKQDGGDGGTVHDTTTAGYVCESCGTIVDELHKLRMLERGEWRPTNAVGEVRTLNEFGRPLAEPEIGDGAFPGFHISALYSPWVAWAQLAGLFVVKNRSLEELKTFVNLQLGEPWEERDVEMKPDELATERYAAEVPNGVGVLVAGVDVQGDRLEVAVRGFGEGEESWLVRHDRIWGDPEADQVWDELEHILARPYQHESGRRVRIRAAMIDSQFLKSRVFRFVKGKETRGVFAAQGSGSTREPMKRLRRPNRQKVKPWTLDADHFKTLLLRRLKSTIARREPGPGYMHFCSPSETGTPDAEYFAQFGAEVRVKVRQGRRFRWVLKQIRDRNEAIDLEYLCIAALHSQGDVVMERLGEYAARLAEPLESKEGKRARKAAPAAPARRNRKNWADGWKS